MSTRDQKFEIMASAASKSRCKYRPLLPNLTQEYAKIKFPSNLYCCIGKFSTSSDAFLQKCNETGIDNRHLNSFFQIYQF